ncbi:MAG TPA: MerR family transcriptional regulator [Stellaceae bacterium]|nr:MerR family transcriptional regulator [Stellaceae bacterium]
MQDAPPLDRSKLHSAAELAREFSLTTQGLRFYEEKGLIAPARVGKTRVYGYRERARLLLIQKLRRLGFSIDAIRDYLNLYRSDASGAAQYRVGLEKIASRIRDLEEKKRDIDEALAGLRALELEAQERLSRAMAEAPRAASERSRGR